MDVRTRRILAVAFSVLVVTATLTPAPVPETPTPGSTATRTDARARAAARRTDCEGAGYRLDTPALGPVRRRPDRYADLGCPVADWADRTVCAHAADASTAPAVLVARDDVADLVGGQGDGLEFALVNRARAGVDLRFRSSAWAVVRPGGENGRWAPVARGPGGCRRAMGNTWAHWWHVGVGADPDPAPATNETAVRVDLRPGTYGFALGVNVVDGPQLLCLAPFTVRRIVGATGDAGRRDTNESDRD